MQERGFNIILEETASGFAARCAELPGCVVMGRSRYEGEEAMRTAIAFHLESLPEGVLLEVILDAGFSDVSGVDNSSWRPEKSVQSHFLDPPVDFLARSEGEEDELDATRAFSEIVRDISGAALWPGSQDQVAAEEANMGGILSGAFTYHLCRQLRETNGQLSRHDTLKRVRQSLRHNGLTQTSQLQSAVNLKSLKTLSLEEIEIAAATRAQIGGAISKQAREKAVQFPGRTRSMKVASGTAQFTPAHPTLRRFFRVQAK